MGRIEWTPVLNIGVEIIDEEHKKIISICNKPVYSVKGD